MPESLNYLFEPIGDAITLIGWGTQIHVLLEVADLVQNELGALCEVVDLCSILPWDVETVCKVNILYLSSYISVLHTLFIYLFFFQDEHDNVLE